MVKTTSLTTAAINALTTGDSSILYNNQTRDLVLYSGSIGFVESSIFNLEINNINGECLILKNNSSLTNYVNFNVSNQGQLNIITNGSSKIVNIHNHNGSSEGLSLGGTLITATATELNKLSGVTATTEELNYVDTTPGTAEASKALVVDANRDISNIRNLQTENLTVNGTLVTSSATELNYNDIATIGTAEPAKALVVDMNKDISGINSLSATELTGEIQTANQPNITSVGTLTSLSTNGLTLNGTQVTATAVELNKLSGATFNVSDLNKLSGVTSTTTELNYVDTTPGTAEASKALVVDANRDITNIRNLQAENLTVNGTLVTSSATELNYNDIATIGTAEPAKALVVDMNKDISGINSLSANELSANELTGEIQTASQPNITSVGTLTSLSTNGLTLNGTQVTATATELNTMDGITATTSELNKLHGVTATTNEINKLSGLTSSTNELNILTGVTASYTELNVLDGITATTSELNYVDTTPGTAEASKALVVDANKNISGINSMTLSGNSDVITISNTISSNRTNIRFINDERSWELGSRGSTASNSNSFYLWDNTANSMRLIVNSTGNVTINGALNIGGNITGTLATASQPNITSVGTLTGLTSSGALNITNNTASTSSSTGALIVTGGAGIGGALNVGGAILATGNITGTLATANQPNITSVGTLTSLSTNSLTLNGTAITSTASELNYVDISTQGTAEASKALILDSSKQIKEITKLQIGTNTTLGSRDFMILNNSANAGFRVGSNESTGNCLTFQWSYVGSNNANNRFSIDFFGKSNQFSILNNGNVGIGLETPSYNLDVNGNINISSGNGYLIGGTNIDTRYLRANADTTATSLVRFYASQAQGASDQTIIRFGHTVSSGDWYFRHHYPSGGPENNCLELLNTNNGQRGLSIGTFNGTSVGDGCMLVLNGIGQDSGLGFIRASSVNCNGALHLNCGIPQSVPANRRYGSSSSDPSNQLGGTVSIALYSYNDIWIRGSMYCTSDKRAKKDIKRAVEIENECMNLLKEDVIPVWYKWKDNTDSIDNLGYIAQNLVLNGVTGLIQEFKNEAMTEECTETQTPAGRQLVVDYSKLNIYLVEICKKLNKKNIELENTIQNILTRLSNLEN